MCHIKSAPITEGLIESEVSDEAHHERLRPSITMSGPLERNGPVGFPNSGGQSNKVSKQFHGGAPSFHESLKVLLAVLRNGHPLPRAPYCAREAAMQMAAGPFLDIKDELFDDSVIAEISELPIQSHMLDAIAVCGLAELACWTTAKFEEVLTPLGNAV